MSSAPVRTVDEAFSRIDSDKSGALDVEELAQALDVAMETHSDVRRLAGMVSTEKVPNEVLTGLASKLVSLYDINGDEELDREEYQKMVQDMAILRKAHEKKTMQSENDMNNGRGRLLGRIFNRPSKKDETFLDTNESEEIVQAEVVAVDESLNDTSITNSSTQQIDFDAAIDVSDSDAIFNSVTGEGSIVLTDLKVDLRRIFFGALPLVKRVSIMKYTCVQHYYRISYSNLSSTLKFCFCSNR